MRKEKKETACLFLLQIERSSAYIQEEGSCLLYQTRSRPSPRPLCACTDGSSELECLHWGHAGFVRWTPCALEGQFSERRRGKVMVLQKRRKEASDMTNDNGKGPQGASCVLSSSDLVHVHRTIALQHRARDTEPWVHLTPNAVAARLAPRGVL